MIIKFKIFENIKEEEVQIGNFIRIFMDGEIDDPNDDFLKYADFVRNNIGKIKNKQNRFRGDNNVRVIYYNIPDNLKKHFEYTYINDDREFSTVINLNNVDDYIIGKTIEEVEMKINSNKYNL
jgi:hypothetical protein